MNIEANGRKTNTVDGVIERLSLSKIHYFIITAAALGFMFDSFDTYVVSYAMPAIIQEWQMDQVMIGILNSAGIWGMFLGAFVWGPVTDRWGRKIGFIGTILGFSIPVRVDGSVAESDSIFVFPVRHRALPGRNDPCRYGINV